MIHCSVCGNCFCPCCWDDEESSDSVFDDPPCDSCWGVYLWFQLEDVAAEQDRRQLRRMVATHAASLCEGEENDDDEENLE